MNETEREKWNSDESHHWVIEQDRYDRQLAPFGDAVLAAAEIAPNDRVLDIGCGCGATTLSAAIVATACCRCRHLCADARPCPQTGHRDRG